MSRLKELGRFGQSVWLDFIRRDLLTSGGLERLVREDGVKGLTSNPAIFEKAIAGDPEYRSALADVSSHLDLDAERIYERIAIEDIQMAAEQMRPVYESSRARDGFVSLEVSPQLAHDSARTIAEAHRLWRAVDRPNVMIKVPATAAGIPAVARLIADGINVNVTLLFAVQTYALVADAWLDGLEHRVAAGKPVDKVASVASFFLSRIDTMVDARLEEKSATAGSDEQRKKLLTLRGKAAVASAKLAYQHFRSLTGGERWKRLARHGAQAQRLLWASTSTKNPAYPDTLYVDELIGADTVNTMPPATLDAFRDHGAPGLTLERDIDGARQALSDINAAGITMREVTDTLLDDGVRLFAEAYGRLLDAVGRARDAA